MIHTFRSCYITKTLFFDAKTSKKSVCTEGSSLKNILRQVVKLNAKYSSKPQI
jgi:hypothetical protein